MPIIACQSDGKLGYKAGPTGTCYTYTKGDVKQQKAALAKAKRQLAAIEISKAKRKGKT